MPLDSINHLFGQQLKQEINNKSTYETWFKDSSIVQMDDLRAVVSVPSAFAIRLCNLTYRSLMEKVVTAVTGKHLRLEFVQNHQKGEEESPPKGRSASLSTNNLNPKYVFDDFIVGENNRFAHAASLAVADNPGNIYNPLFIYGGVGLGKTHLMHAIGHHCLEKDPKAKILYVSSQTFTNDLINKIKEGKAEDFRKKYRSIDVLLIDDIQFLINKDKTQEEFFHTFNYLKEQNKQIVITSDAAPSKLSGMEERLINRFNWGLSTDISNPDFETRTAILKKKAEIDHIDFEDDVFKMIASRITTNIRELEGALTRMDAYITFNNLTNADITESFVDKILKDITRNSSAYTYTDLTIKKAVANFYGLSMEDLNSRRRSRNISYPRQIAMYLIRELTDYPLTEIGKIFGGKDHTTVIHAVDKIKIEIQTKPELNQVINQIKENLESGKY